MIHLISKMIKNILKASNTGLKTTCFLSSRYGLVALSDEQLPSLLHRLRGREDSIQVAGEIEARLTGTLMDYEILVDQWPDYRAIVCRVNRATSEFPIHLGPKVQLYAWDNVALESLLRRPGVLDWSSQISLQFPDHLYQAVMKVLKAKRRLIKFVAPRDVWTVDRTTLKTIDIPNGFHMDRIKPDQISQVDDVWALKNEQSMKYIEFVSERLPSTCLIDKKGRVVGFAQAYHNGEMGMLHVHEQFRCKGYARVIMSHLIRSCIETKRHVYALAPGRENITRVNEAIGLVRLPYRKMFYCDLQDMS